MKTGKWLSLKSKKNFKISSNNLKFWYNQEIIDFRFSSSGRYGFLVRERPLTYYYDYLFTVIDTLSGSLTNYKMLTCLFKTYHRFYLLSDELGVLLDFSRHNGIVSQHLLHFDHSKFEVHCEYSRNWRFKVDEMLSGTDGTYVTGTSQLLHINKQRFVPLLGQLSFGYIMMRIVPANPLNIGQNFSQIINYYFIFNPNEFVSLQSIKVLNFNENDDNNISQTSITTSNYLINNQQNVVDCTTDYPFIYNSRLIFFVRRKNNLSSAAPLINHSISLKHILEIDVTKLFNKIIYLSNKSQTELNHLKMEASPTVSLDTFLLNNLILSNNQQKSKPIFEVIKSSNPCINMRLLNTELSELNLENDIIEMYSYIQAGLYIYIRAQYRNINKQKIFSKWICLNLQTYEWRSLFRQPCRARIPFWFCGIPDGRAFFYRQVWKRGTRQVAFRQIRMMLPHHQVLLLKQLCFFKLDIYQFLKDKIMLKQNTNSLKKSKQDNESNLNDNNQDSNSLLIKKNLKITNGMSHKFLNHEKINLITELAKNLQLFDSF